MSSDPRIILVTTCTPDYARPWIFPTLGMTSHQVRCLLHPEDKRPLPINAVRIPYEAPGCNYQAGQWLEAFHPKELSNDDVVVLLDADGVLQRDLNENELETLRYLEDGFAMGYNSMAGQKGGSEFHNLRPNVPLEVAAAALGVTTELMCNCWVYNTGMIGAKVKSWRKLLEWYSETFKGKTGEKLFGIWSWQQYFICMVLSRYRVPVVELGYDTHSHCHYPLTREHIIVRRQLYYGGRRVLFAHNVPGVSH